jgi:hypothetical protein
MEVSCNICNCTVTKIFDSLVLNKYTVSYFKCENCGFIQTEKPFWLKEAYSSAITAIDVGLVYRNIQFSDFVPKILDISSSLNDSYIDYGGGYGLFVRIMRDKGYDFFLHDKYAENIFAKHFKLKDYRKKTKFNALTSFEVFEHLINPIEELEKMLELSDCIIFSTELQPSISINNPEDWWYFSPETGQHISFYTENSLKILGEKFNLHLYSNKYNLHIFSKKEFSIDPFVEVANVKRTLIKRILSKIKFIKDTSVLKEPRVSLLQKDFEYYKSIYNSPFKDND